MEKYLNKCLDSLLVTNMDLIEVLVINDGSKDNSSAIAHEYQDKYPNVFKVIDKENGNYGSCINRGLKEATGKYVKILDADDSFYSSNFDRFLDEIKDIDVDLILTDFISEDEQGNVLRKSNYPLPFNVKSDYLHLFRSGKIDFQINMHAITYKLQNLVDMNYQQTEGISYTDMEWCFTPMTKVRTGVYLKFPVYRYLLGRPGQTMDESVKKKQIIQLMKMTESLAERYNKCYDQDYHLYLNFISKSQIINIYKVALFENLIDWKLLDDYDDAIQKKSYKLYLELNNIKYIKFYRKYHNKFLQSTLNIVIKIIKSTRK